MQKKPLFFFLYFCTFLEPFRLLVVRFCSSLLILLLRLMLVILLIAFVLWSLLHLSVVVKFNLSLFLATFCFFLMSSSSPCDYFACLLFLFYLLWFLSWLDRELLTLRPVCPFGNPPQRLINISKNSVKDRFSFIRSASCSVPEWQQWALAVTLIRDAGSPSITSRAHRQKTPPRNRARALTIFGNM